ncbi:MAG: hypothetical protein A2505_06250 [Deltaproteobacteria bacterium RIFOXYD12_FULL_55_16]|nr:MAG: hypothetical protein A2505_06250 [Deltaproteobacteria bacterium RIFOXYD12_FULL_55_16]
MMQFNLFQLDMLAVGKGYQCLAALDFVAAREHFARVLAVLPEHHDAGQGMVDAGFWEELLAKAAEQTGEEAPVFLWERISIFPFVEAAWGHDLRKSLLRRLLTMLDDWPDFYRPPDLCRGYLYLQLGEYRAVATALRRLLARQPENGRLWGYLGDALWSGRQGGAAEAYARALLTAPHQVAADKLHNAELAELIREHGPEMAPVQGFLAGLLPLPELPKNQPRSPAAQICELLRRAEQARHAGDHEQTITARRHLRELAPETLRDYLTWLKNN